MIVKVSKRRSLYVSLSTASLMLFLAGCSAADCDPNKQDEMFTQMACSFGGGYQKRTKALTNERSVQEEAVQIQDAHLMSINQQIAVLRQEMAQLQQKIAKEKAQRDDLLRQEVSLQQQYDQAKADGDSDKMKELIEKIRNVSQIKSHFDYSIKIDNAAYASKVDELNKKSAETHSL